jgi:hypothetical protein
MVCDVWGWWDCLRRVGGVSGPGVSARENLCAGKSGHGNRGDWGLCVVGDVVQCDEWNDAGCFGRGEAAQTLSDADLESEYVDGSGVQRLSEHGEGSGLRED